MTGILILSFAVLLRILANPVANVFQKQLTAGGLQPLFVNCITYSLLALVCLLPALAIPWGQAPMEFWYYSLGVGITGALGNGFLVKALQGGELSVLGPVNAYKSVVGMVTGILLLRELPNVWGIIGIMLIIYGSYFVLDTTEERFSTALFRKREIQYRILAMVLTGIEAVLLKKTVLLSSVTASFITWCWFGAIFSFFLFFTERRTGMQHEKQPFPYIKFVLLAACIGTMQYATNFIFERMTVGYALSLFQLSTLVTVYFGFHFFREKQMHKKILGTLIMIAGSVMIILLQ